MIIHRDTHILVVDDSDVVRGIIRKLLARLGFNNVDEASDGAVALAKISEKKYGLVISDWNMEPMDGRALLTQVRANKKYENLPFIIMTAETAINKVVQASHAGASCFINKPFNAEGLKAKIEQISAA